ncbi:5'-nucleotidase /3'-nucleotidase /exopolyphosphatase [Loktanella fryxellensis]|uniref:5'-nucleotidase SurE n=1 Tax=Loktanella fryxellensis TaxID=245187 RepID=A0A1H7YVU2_9RHOB|nr:5'/3'-nucleotidase SurE [Loktanella fryxellensis]SEM50083.1 5'-nucleotidase /3'-nucleotidase /exopolyphosphatase [Loktanella fryxellensis]
MRILITNDDGINAPGLVVLDAIARELAGPEGEVWTVAPAFEQSGVGHCISYTHPTMISEFGPRRFAAEGTPADCVLAALYDVMQDAPPDLILSGVNRGNNAAENVVYSGTIGAAMEGALQGYRAIALSQYYGPRNVKLADPFEAASATGVALIRRLLHDDFWQDSDGPGHGYRPFYNINFPAVPAAEVQGVRMTRQGLRDGIFHSVEAQVSPTGRRFMWVRGGNQQVDTGPGTDASANLAGYVSVTPLRADLTAHDMLDRLQGRLDDTAPTP